MIQRQLKSSGFTLVETLVTVAIFVLILGVVTGWETDIFKQNRLLSGQLTANQDAQATLRRLVAELRAAAPSETGAYPLAAATAQSLTFFSDADGDGVRDQIRYFISGNTLARGVIKPTGSPLTYVAGNEVISPVVNKLTDTSQTVFSYYDENYNGLTAPLALPVAVTEVRVIKISLKLGVATYTTQVMVRSLKDN